MGYKRTFLLSVSTSRDLLELYPSSRYRDTTHEERHRTD